MNEAAATDINNEVNIIKASSLDHVCECGDVSADHKCKCESHGESKTGIKAKDVESLPPLTSKEYRALKKAKYGSIANKYNQAFLLRNKKTGQVVEIRAVGSYHACRIIGWKPQQVTLLQTRTIEDAKTDSKENA